MFHDRITRTPGSFEAFLKGTAYLKEAGAGFTVQIVPMKDNFSQFKDMVRLAESLSPPLEVGGFLALSLRFAGIAGRISKLRPRG